MSENNASCECWGCLVFSPCLLGRLFDIVFDAYRLPFLACRERHSHLSAESAGEYMMSVQFSRYTGGTMLS